ncbi:MAG: tetratricopeptide repeat protein [Methylococcaceae bacterium]
MIDLSNKKILVVDDIPMMRTSIKAMVDALGAKDIDMAGNAIEALQKISTKPFDIILCDYYLGDGKSGQQVLEESKTLGLLKANAIFIMITAEKARHQIMSVVEYRPDAYLIKPFNKDTLRYNIEKTVDRKSNFEEIHDAVDKKDYKTAITLCDKKARENPQNSVEYFKIKAGLLLDTGQYDKARSIYEAFLAKRELSWARFGLGKVMHQTGLYAEAKEIFEEILKQNNNMIEAYDWLANSLLALGENEQAQNTLHTATRLSPGVLRLRTLAELAFKNKDMEGCCKAYKELIHASRDSAHKSLTDYVNYSDALNRLEKPGEALNILKTARSNFKSSAENQLRIALARGVIYSQAGKTVETSKCVKEARKQYEMNLDNLDTPVALEIINSCLTVGEKDYAKNVSTVVSSHNPEDTSLTAQIEALFEQAAAAEAARMRAKAAESNHKGVEFFEKGRLEEAYVSFEMAVTGEPDNLTYAINAAQVLIIDMQKKGGTEEQIKRARELLEISLPESANDNRHARLVSMYKTIKVKKK